MYNYFKMMRNLIVLAVCGLLMLTGCEKKPETPATKKVVSKKIDISGKKVTDTKTTEKKVVKTPAKMVDAQKITGKEQVAPVTSPSVELKKKTGKLAYVYDPSNKIDPFESIFRKREEAEAKKEKKGKRKKRIPLTPLEKIALSQLKLVAVMLAPSGNRALVEEASGKGYIITNGTYIGKNSGRVVNILLDKVVVEEEVEDVLGTLVVRKTEMKLQKTPGE